MPRYYFDIRDGGVLCPDEEGLEFANLRAAAVEAAMSLAGMAKELVALDRPRPMGIEVRTDEGPLFRVAFVVETAATRQQAGSRHPNASFG